jgi:hypothetical protein
MEQSPQYFNRYTSSGFLFYFIVKRPVQDDRFSYKTALLLGIEGDLMSMLEDYDDFEYYAEDYRGDASGLASFMEDNGCSGDDCMSEQAFDAPDNVYPSLERVISNRTRWKNNEAVTNSYRTAYTQIMNTYKPKLKEFTEEMVKLAKKSFMSYHKMDLNKGTMETLSDILRDAGVTDFDNLSFSDATNIINDYIKDNTFDYRDLGDENLDFSDRFPLEDR